MAEPVKPKRRYNSPRRREQAAATRRSILDAAQRLFERQGYAATTMEAIAAEAGVALKTVYVVFETKSGLLRALWDLRLKGDEDDAPVAERQWYLEVIEEPDPERQLRLNARNARVVKLRDRATARGHSRRGARRARHRRALGADPDRLLRQPAVDRRVGRREARAEARPRRRARGRHPLDAQPPRPVAAARRPSAVGHPSSSSSGSPTPRARSCSGAAKAALRGGGALALLGGLAMIGCGAGAGAVRATGVGRRARSARSAAA